MQIEIWPVTKPKPYVKNPRRQDGPAITMLAEAIKKYGFRNPIQVDKHGVIIAGHTRLKAAMQAGLTEVPVIVHHDMSESEANALRIADNKLAELTDWDMGLLISELHGLDDVGHGLDGMGFSDQELAQLFGTGGPTDTSAEWVGMPEFDQQDKRAFRTFPVHFKDQAAVDEFARLIKQNITPNTRFVWFPQIEIETFADKEYSA